MIEVLIYTILLTVILFAAYKYVKTKMVEYPAPRKSSHQEIPQELKEYTPEELSKYDGRSESTPIYISIKGKVYDVSPARHFYGPGSSYNVFAGREAARGLARMSTDIEDVENVSLDDLDEEEIENLNGWIEKFDSKYVHVGYLLN